MCTQLARVAAFVMALLVFASPLYGQEKEQQPEVTDKAKPVADEVEATAASATIIDVAQEAGTFSTFLAALDAADLTVVLKGDGPYTLFAPTDEAFAKLPEGTLENLMKPENKEQLKALLMYHVIEGQATPSADVGAASTTLQGSDLTIVSEDGTVRINDAVVVDPDIEAGNGIIHVIDTVLMPPSEQDDDM